MIVLCAWCEQEGRHAVIRKTESSRQMSPSHGICEVHEKVLRKQIRQKKFHTQI